MLRDVVESDRFTYDFDRYSNLYSRMNDVHAAVTWTLSHDPWIGEVMPQFPDFHIFFTTAMGDTPSFRVLYEVTETQVLLHALEVDDGVI